MTKQELLRSIPRVDDIITLAQAEPDMANASYHELLTCVREVLDEVRGQILREEMTRIPNPKNIVRQVVKKVAEECAGSLRPVINATGVVLHTNLGRAVLAEVAAENVKQVARQYNTLEYSLDEGARGSRHAHVEGLICKLTGAEAAMAVNNNAAAVMLMLAAICKDKQVAVSRGELVEIGGSFRVPEIMELSGAQLKEVGTTNKTRIDDYQKALLNGATALLKVHTSNFKVVGFSQSVEIAELATLGKDYGVPVLYDLGSGLMLDGAALGIPNEANVPQSIKDGADVVCFSADKLLGGPQAGIIAGKKEYIDKMKKHQFARVVRIDKLNLAALEATLRIYLDQDRAKEEIPTLANLAISKSDLRQRAAILLDDLPQCDGFSATIKMSESQVGGGSAPGELLPSYVVQITPTAMSAAELEKRLRKNSVPIICRIHQDKVLLDPRTLFEWQYEEIAKALQEIFA